MQRRLNRRQALCCTGALCAGLFTGLLAAPQPARAAFGPFKNPCLGALPPHLAQHDIVLAAFEGLDVTRLVDTHAHLLGTGDAGSGCTVHPSLYQWWHPLEVLRRKGILDAACVDESVPSIDRAYVARLQFLADGFPAGARWWLFAFDQACHDDGTPAPEWTTFHVPDAYASQVAAAHRTRFDWVASIHPYRPDALDRLGHAAAQGAVAVKWLPGAMNINLADPRCKPFYDRLAARRLPLIVHCGEEKAVPGARQHAYGNPLAVRAALKAGVQVVMAHCGSLGKAADTDTHSQREVAAFSLFERVMAEADGQLNLRGDISAAFQRNRDATVWQALVQRDDWHGRLLHGSDHPLPGLVPLFAPEKIAAAGLLAEADVAPLKAIRQHNPLLFDLVLKRRLRSGDSRFPAAVFEGRALNHTASPT